MTKAFPNAPESWYEQGDLDRFAKVLGIPKISDHLASKLNEDTNLYSVVLQFEHGEPPGGRLISPLTTYEEQRQARKNLVAATERFRDVQKEWVRATAHSGQPLPLIEDERLDELLRAIDAVKAKSSGRRGRPDKVARHIFLVHLAQFYEQATGKVPARPNHRDDSPGSRFLRFADEVLRTLHDAKVIAGLDKAVSKAIKQTKNTGT